MQILANHARGEVEAVVSVGVLAEGWDNPNCNIIVHLRPTYPSLLKNSIDDSIRFFNSFPEATSLKSVEKLVHFLFKKKLLLAYVSVFHLMFVYNKL